LFFTLLRIDTIFEIDDKVAVLLESDGCVVMNNKEALLSVCGLYVAMFTLGGID
jgi:hypothetical protein